MNAAASLSYRQGGASRPVLILLFALAAVSLALYTLASAEPTVAAVIDNTRAGPDEFYYGMGMLAQLPPIEQTGSHADVKHPEAAYVRQTCKERGVYQVWRETFDKNTFHLLCLTVDNKLVDWVIVVIENSRFIEKTAFMPRAGVMAEVIKYVAGKATRFTKGW